MRTAERHYPVAWRRDGDGLVIQLSGDWNLNDGLADFSEVLSMAEEEGPVVSVAFDTVTLGTWDSSLITFLLQGVATCEKSGIVFQAGTLPENVQRLLTLALVVPEKETRAAAENISFLYSVGQWALSITGEVRLALTFIGESLLSLGRLLTGRSRMRWGVFWEIVQTNGPGALPIVALICFMVGLIIAFLGAVILQRFGAGIYSAHVVGFGMLRELGALMTGIIMVGRTGASFAAEIGSMKVSEEIDALQTMGVSPMDYIVLPRMLALFLIMPFLTVYGDAVGILGGMAVSTSMMDISLPLFFSTMFDAISFFDFGLGVIKGTIFGGLIAIAGCQRGLQCGDSADAVGAATTSAVVTGITLIVLANAVIDWLATF